MKLPALLLSFCACIFVPAIAQHEHHSAAIAAAPATQLDHQPLLAQVVRLNEALRYIGSPLSEEDSKAIVTLRDQPASAATSQKIQSILDPYCIAIVQINPEARVSVEPGHAAKKIIDGGWKNFLVRVNNQAGINSKLHVESPNSRPVLHGSENGSVAKKKNAITTGELSERFLELKMYNRRPMQPELSGIGIEYVILQVYCKGKGKREASIGFNVGQGTQDIGHRNMLPILFEIKPSVQVVLNVKDDDGSPTMASFTITDDVNRVFPDSNIMASTDYRLTLASNEYYRISNELLGIYPLPSRRLALTDKYPDFFFQPQVYRADGETIELPSGTFKVRFTRGPEYIAQDVLLIIPDGVSNYKADFKLKRWVNMAKMGWYSADHHIHAAGCSHYESPEQGVDPEAMIRQIKGEDLNVGAVLTWGPGWYHQKRFFTGVTSKISTPTNVMHYDVEVSGFPSSHAGHIVLLGLKEDDYPGTTRVEDWPSWTAPVLSWAKKQNSLTGYAHSGWGLQPIDETNELPNYSIPKMDGIGANEFVVTVTQGLVDIYSAGDTPLPWELNMYYHVLNSGFRTRLSGETDFPCIFDERVGIARSYFKAEGGITYDKYVEALRQGRSYVSDGRSHIIDFKVNDVGMGEGNSELNLSKASTVKVTGRVNAWLDKAQSEAARSIASRDPSDGPYWHLERARIGESQRVAVELLFNGTPVDTLLIVADGQWNDLSAKFDVQQSGWIALRILGSSHTNPIFVLVDKKPIAVAKSAAWCRDAVDQCWKMKKENIRKDERDAAERAYNAARILYDNMAKK